MRLSYIKYAVSYFKKVNKFLDNPYSALFQYIEGKPIIKLKIKNTDVSVTRNFFEQLVYGIVIDKISSIEIFNDQLIVNNNIRFFSCKSNEHEYFDDNPFLALTLAEKAEKLGWKYENGTWTNGTVRFLAILRGVLDAFSYNLYYTEGVKNRDVVDIGGNIGDTAILYKLHGARKVISVEPLGLPYNLAKVHMKLNNITNVDIIRGAVVGKKDRERIRVPRCYPLYGSGSFSLINTRITLESDEIDTFTLEEILPDDPYILKMDCEGCEADIILRDYETVKKFQIINFEIHEKETGIPHEVLVNKLKEDYDVKVYYRPGENDSNTGHRKPYVMILARKRT